MKLHYVDFVDFPMQREKGRGKNDEKMGEHRKLKWLRVAQKVPQDVATSVQDSSYFASFKHCSSDGMVLG